jgi:hypothetical protein
MKSDVINMFLRLEQRITSLENFINKYDFSKLKSHEHHADGNCYLTNPPRFKCIHCGEFYR